MLFPALSLPSRGAWIEMPLKFVHNAYCKSLPSRGAWIEITDYTKYKHRKQKSLPSRGAWIEIPETHQLRLEFGVAPLAGSVD